MRIVLLLLVGFFSLILQSTLFSKITFFGAKPDILLILTVFLSFIKGPKKGFIIGFSLGFLEDLFLAQYLGLNALAKGFLGFLVGFLEKRMYKDNYLLANLILLLASVAYFFIFLGLANLVGYELCFSNLKQLLLPFLVYNLIFGPFIYHIIYKTLVYREGR